MLDNMAWQLSLSLKLFSTNVTGVAVLSGSLEREERRGTRISLRNLRAYVAGALLRVRGRKEGALIRPGTLGLSTSSLQEDPRVPS